MAVSNAEKFMHNLCITYGAKFGLLLLLLLVAGSVLAASELPHSTPWNVIAGSDVIVVGIIQNVVEDPPVGHDPRVSDSRSGKLDIVVLKTLKGHAPDKLRTDYYVSVGWSDALLDSIKELRGKTAILFMLSGTSHDGLWFAMPAIYGSAVITAYSPDAEQRVKDELSREPLQVSDAAYNLSKLDGGTVESQVQAAIESMASEQQARIDAGVEQLHKLGCQGLPYIIKHMDDRRLFHGIVKGPSSWEAYAQYRAKQMTDALVIVLGQITNPIRPDRDDFSIDDMERRKMINAWILYYAHHQMHDKSDPSQLPDMCD